MEECDHEEAGPSMQRGYGHHVECRSPQKISAASQQNIVPVSSLGHVLKHKITTGKYKMAPYSSPGVIQVSRSNKMPNSTETFEHSLQTSLTLTPLAQQLQ